MSSKTKNNLKFLNTILLNITVISVLGFLVFSINKTKDVLVGETNLQILIKNCDSLHVSKDIKIQQELIKLKGEVTKIEEVNNKRFEILGWGLGILITVIAILLVVTYINSKASMRDMVYEEIHSKNSEFMDEYNALLNDMKSKRDDINSQIEGLN
jgi:hypothetical protein